MTNAPQNHDKFFWKINEAAELATKNLSKAIKDIPDEFSIDLQTAITDLLIKYELVI